MSPNEIELIYELSPMQQAMLFHSLYAPGSGVYLIQMSLRLTGRLDLAAFLRAWQRVVERHGILRTAFFWEGLEKPLQVVYRQVDLPVRRESWRGLDPGEQATRLSSFLESERDRGLDLAEAPLMRLALFELEAGVHQMVWTLHHVLVDGWSQGRLLRELFTCYSAFTEGGEPHLAPAGSFRDYIAWLQRQDPGKAEAFWRKSLAGFTAPTLLAGGEGRGGGPSWREARRRDLRLPAETTAGLREAARRHRLTVNTLVQGAWSLLLAQASGRDDVVFGTTVAGRPADLPGVESTLGLFINTQPVRVPVRPDERLWPWLAALQERQVEMRRFEHSPLVDVQRWSELPAGVPLFDHLLVFENVALPAELSRPVPGLEIAEEAAHDLTNYPLNVVAIPGPELLLTIRYDASRFEAPEVARLLERLARLLEAFAADRDLALHELPLLLPAERHQALMEWNDTARVFETGACLHELVARQAERTPTAVAASFEGAELTYRELESRAGLLARHLTGLGVRADDRVGVRMERSLEMIVGLLGILKAGAAYVPLDPSWPEERLAVLVESAGISVMLGPEGTLTPGPSPASGRGENGPLLDEGGLAYVLYTSGSTGTPKGVMIPHRGIVNRLLWMQEEYGLTSGDRVLQKTPFSFDVSVWEFFWPLLVGARLVFAKPEGHKDPLYLVDLIAREKITTLHFVPSMLQAFLEAPRLESLTSLRRVMASGEALPPDLVRRFSARLPGVELHNLYGPTEASVDVSFWACPPAPPLVPIGRPIANLRLHVADREMRPLPIGVPGELLLGGVGLARGYLGQPELTAAAFVPDPFGEEPGGRLYRTGDLTRFLSDGTVEYLGRIDHQVKIRGFRIELGEIEAVLASHPVVRECVVLARRDLSEGGGDPRLVAYVILNQEAGIEHRGLAEHLRERLPEYMVPAAFVFLDAFPLTTSGKVDRKALPAPEKPGADATAYVAPADPVEELLAGTWADVLGVERVGARDDFFALGGHSLLATQVASRIREAFGVEIPLRHLFEAPTVAGLAERIDAQAAALTDREALLALLGELDFLSEEEAQARLEDSDAHRAMARGLAALLAPAPSGPKQALPAAPVPLPRQDGTAELPLSFAQQRLWFLDQLEPDSPAYNIPLPVRLQGELPVALLERIAAEIVRRHETLRTTFAAREGQPVQVVHPDLRPGLPVVDLAALPDAEREAQRIAQDEALRPFDLRTGPLLRLTFVRVAERDHLLLITLHHIIADGWSMRVLLREVAALFEAFSQGRPSPLAGLPFQYADFAVWQRQWLEGRVLEEQLAFWKERLAGAPQVLELPTDRPRPAVQTARGDAVTRPLAPAVSAAVRELCRRADVTPFMALLTAWAVLLGRHADQDDLLVGTPVAGRHARGTEHLIGFFANTLVLRVQPRDALTFQSLLGQVRQASLDAFSHQDIPFERLVEELVPARDLSRSPLFQAMFVLQDAGRDGWRMPGLAIRPVPLDGQTSKFDVLLTLADDGTGFAASLEYSTDLFDEDRMVRLLQGFEVLLAGAAAAPERAVAALPLLTAEERNLLLVEWNDDPMEHRRVAVHQPVEEQAERTPEELAAVWVDGGSLTYRELNRRANQLAHHLRALGVGPDDRVSICLERSLDLLVAVLGVLKAGGAYVPVDPDYPADRVAFMLADSRSRVLVTASDVMSRLPALPVLSVLIDKDREAIAARDGENPARWTTPDHLAYVIYTSGSTGRPKGVAMPHGVLAHMLAWQTRDSTVGAGSRTLQFASLSFDVSFQEIFSTWWTGGTLVALPQETRRDAMALCQVLDEQRVERLFLPFVALQQLAEIVDHGMPPPAALREIVTAGEQLQITRQIAGWMERSGAVLVNHYGPSEGHVVTAHHLTGPTGAWPALPPIGRPLPNLGMYLLDHHLEPVPQGVPGHLCFGGVPVVRGYLDRPELTAEKFIPDPFSREPGARLYATGDQARYLADGTLQYVGRIDQQVKIRGYRVEPGEVETVLARHPAVREAAVVVRGEGPDKRLVGYYVAEAQLDGEALRAFLREELPEYMVPAVLVRLDALPLTPSGKLDRKALPAPPAEETGGVGPAAPGDPVEELLAGIWAEVLGRGRGRVGVRDDFFSLGGHSLLATQVISRVRGALGVELPLRQLFETPTIEGFARAVRAAGPGDAPAAPPIVPVPREDRSALPLSFAQQRLWLIDQLEPGSPAYNIPLAVRLAGDVAPDLLERIFGEIVRRHEILRTTFESRPGGPVQVIASPESCRVELKRFDLSHLPESTREARAHALARDEARFSFDLRRGPLWRLVLVRLGEREHLLLLTLHHIVTDGWSMGVLLREIAALHEAYSQGRPSPLPELPVQYADFAVWQRSWLQGDVLEAQLEFWKRRLDGAPQVLDLPTDRPRPPVQTFRGAAQPVALSPVLSEALVALCRRRGATPFMALLTAWSVLLGRLADQDDLLVGTPIAGRNRRETEDLIGFFVNTLVLRTGPGPGSTFEEMLGRIRETTLEAFAHQDLPFERLVEELVPQRDLSRSPLFQVVFVLQNAPAGTLNLPGLSLAPLEVESGIAKFDLLLALMEGRDGFAGALEYNVDLFDASTAERLASRFLLLLEGAVAAPETALFDLPFLFPAELEQVLRTWNDTSTEYPRESSLPELFAQVARELPEAPAIVSADGEVWTYRRLSEASVRLARHLRSLGVGTESAVGLCLERSPELIVGALAILQAGGFYVPLDAAYPDERLRFMQEDTGARVVLVDAATRERLAGLVGAPALVAVDAKDDRDTKDDNGIPASLRSLESLRSLPEALAYVIYTSGSTGRPKGVAVTHRAIVRLVRETDYVRLGPGARTGHVASISFDAATYEIWGALLTGAAVAVIPRETVLDPPAFAAALQEQRVTSMFLTSALFTKMAAEVPDAFQQMSELLVGGEAVDPAAARRILEHRPPRRLLNGYGPTESTTFAAWHHIREVPAGAAGIPIGRPLANTTLYVLDRRQEPVPPGSTGELCIGGDGLARGYWNRPELTAERFVPHPWGRGERLYRTGDLVRQRPDGLIEYLGRLDSQVKIRGFRIEPGEVEALLASQPGVAACAVLARRDDPAGDARLVAYVVPAAGAELTGESLREDLKRTLPDYMLPSATVFLESLPLTPNGKLDRRALPAPVTADILGAATGFVAPSDPVEERLAAIWADALGLDQVGVDNDFFSLGGHSLLATQVVSRVRNELGLELPLRAMFEMPTIRQQARSLRGEPAGPEEELELASNVPLAVHLVGELATETLQKAYAEVIHRHAVLRATQAMPEMQVLDLSEAPEEAREEWVHELVLGEARASFDLEHGPLLRLSLLRLADREHLLLATLSSSASGGRSMGALLDEMGTLYAAFEPGAPPFSDLHLRDITDAELAARAGHIFEAPELSRSAVAPPVVVSPIVPAPPKRTEEREISIRLAGLSAEKRQLLDAVLRELRAEPAAAALITPRRDPGAPVPLSFSQERMWFLHLLDPASAVYNVFLGVRLDGALRPDVLAAAFAELTRRHQILVTRYELLGATPVQVIDPAGPFRLPQVDLSTLPAERRAEELDRRQAEESGRPFDLVQGPVLRASVVHLAPAENVLLLTVHHIAIDGWSLRVLLNELAAVYAAFAAGEPSPLPAPPLQYADYAAWQRRQSDVLEARRAWWRRQLQPPLPVLSLPTDAPRQVPQPFRLATEQMAIPAGLTADLHALGAGRGASLFMVLLAGLAAVLHRTGGDERILVGTPVAGRNRREVEDLVGFFLNTLVLPVGLEGDPGFGALLQSTARMALEAFSHQDLPLETLLQELRIGDEAGGARGPFQVLLLVQNLRRLRIEVPGLTLTGLAGERQADLGTAVFELGLTVEEHGGALAAAMSYNALLFGASTIQRLLGHLRTLLGGAVADPAAPLSALPLLSSEEREEVLAWNPPVSAVAGPPVPVLFAAQAARTPGAEALRHGGRSLTYGELEGISRGIAERLHAQGVGPEVPVAVFLDRSPELIAAFLGVLRAGGIYAPLDPALPEERLTWILDDLAPAALITDGTLAARISWQGPTLFVDAAGEAARGALPSPVPEQGAYLIYTSGSTGRPKGVVVPHGAMSAFVAAARDLYEIGPEDRVLQFASLGFDTSVEEIYPCLTAGGTLVLRTDQMAGSIAGFLQGCEDQGITVLDLPTAFWHELVTSPELAERGLPIAVRAVILGGERPLPERVAAWLRQMDPRVRLFNTYGPTEATVVATAAELAPDLAAESWREVPMGRPLPGVQAHVLDRGQRPVPVGVPGEVVLGGNALARGYLGRPDLTAERFIPDPFQGVAGARLYRTGDLARRRADGSLEFAGRVDHQVKIRGFRVEPGEIESVLAACPEVGECAVVARDDSSRPGDLQLVAYVVPASGRKASVSDLRTFLESRLPAWMIPAAFVPLAALPLTPTGKIDRRALPAPDGSGLEPERPWVAPRNEIEEAIVDIWREALRVERLSVFDSFFELGGNSLLLLQVMRRLRETFDLEVPLRSIFEERTVAALAKKVEELLIQEIQQLA